MPVEPRLAEVRPRVRVGAETLRLEDVVGRELQAGTWGLLCITGGPGSGKSTALRHLAARFAEQQKRGALRLLDEPTADQLGGRNQPRLVVYTATTAAAKPFNKHYELAPWGEDDWIEYLLALHHGRCKPIMQRLKAASDRAELGGVPALCALVLDAFAADDNLRDVRSALWAHMERVARRKRTAVRRVAYGLQYAEFPERLLAGCGVPQRVTQWLRFHPIQKLLAVDYMLTALRRPRPPDWLRMPLRSLDLVDECALRLRTEPDLRDRLKEHYLAGDGATQPMIASLLVAWNPRWRPPGGATVRLLHAHLRGAQWANVNLSRVDLSRADLEEADLSGAVLKDGRIFDAQMTKACLHVAEIEGTTFAKSDLTQADVTEARGPGVCFAHTKLLGARLDSALLDKADFEGALLNGASLKHASLVGALLVATVIDEADFSGADLRTAQLNGLPLYKAEFGGARFDKAHLDSCVMAGMRLAGCSFVRAWLHNADLTGSFIPDGDFTGAFLPGAGLAEIEWERANLTNADLRGATFHMGSSRSGLIFSPIAGEGSRTGFYTEELAEDSFRPPEEIRKANLRGADLRGAKIEGVDFYLVDLREALFDEKQAEHFRKCGAILSRMPRGD